MGEMGMNMEKKRDSKDQNQVGVSFKLSTVVFTTESNEIAKEKYLLQIC